MAGWVKVETRTQNADPSGLLELLLPTRCGTPKLTVGAADAPAASSGARSSLGNIIAGRRRRPMQQALLQGPARRVRAPRGWGNVISGSGNHHTHLVTKTWLPDALLRGRPSSRAPRARGAGCPTPPCGH